MRPIILTDSCADWNDSFYKENDIERIKMTYIQEGQAQTDLFDYSIDKDTDDFYEMMRNGARFSTSQITSSVFYNVLGELAKQERPIVYIAFSSALSSTYNSACTAVQMLKEEIPKIDVTVIDSKCASTGLGMMVYHANNLRNEGKCKEEIVEWVEANKMRMNHWVKLHDLNYLRRSGRVSAPAAFIGTVLDIKPLLWMDENGFMATVDKERGRNKILKAIFNKTEERIEKPEEQDICISYGDCEEDALMLKEMVEQKIPVKSIMLSRIGPIIGSHTGPGVLSIFFLGKDRKKYRP